MNEFEIVLISTHNMPYYIVVFVEDYHKNTYFYVEMNNMMHV